MVERLKHYDLKNRQPIVNPNEQDHYVDPYTPLREIVRGAIDAAVVSQNSVTKGNK